MNLELDLKSTLNLPDSDFTIPMKADLGTREPSILSDWGEAKIYHAILARSITRFSRRGRTRRRSYFTTVPRTRTARSILGRR